MDSSPSAKQVKIRTRVSLIGANSKVSARPLRGPDGFFRAPGNPGTALPSIIIPIFSSPIIRGRGRGRRGVGRLLLQLRRRPVAPAPDPDPVAAVVDVMVWYFCPFFPPPELKKVPPKQLGKTRFSSCAAP
ncbi:hypothetical protein PG994_013467 [Apiospora phragmitis]|uniref:Uncharacterized protein n=1 Tax=Apiospora phragmitis TaxID=2905665 RepID=A0ABR1T8R0_9PEZI